MANGPLVPFMYRKQPLCNLLRSLQAYSLPDDTLVHIGSACKLLESLEIKCFNATVSWGSAPGDHTRIPFSRLLQQVPALGPCARLRRVHITAADTTLDQTGPTAEWVAEHLLPGKPHLTDVRY
jgi:hypothetical protein